MPAPAQPLPAGDLDHVLAHTRGLWPAARGQSFFITGGTGFFGVWLLESFLRANDELGLGMRAVVLTRDPAAFAQKAPHLSARSDLEFCQGDLGTFEFPAGHFDHVIHAAADTAIWTKGAAADGFIGRLTASTAHLLEFVAQAEVKNFLHVSSGAVYGDQPETLAGLPEDYAGIDLPLPPQAAWAEGKRVAERLCVAHAARQKYALKIARCFTFVGPHLPLDAKYAMSNFLSDGLRGRPIEVAGDGTTVRSYLYASDLAVWLWTILFRGPAGRAFNVGSPEAVSIAELACLVNRVFAQQFPVKIKQAVIPGNPVSRYVPSVERAAAELGLQVRVSLPAALEKTAAWYRAARP